MPTWIAVAAVIAMVMIGVVVLVQLIAITALLFVVKNLAEEIRERIDPLIVKTNSLLVTANEIAQGLKGKTEHISDTTTQTADVLASRVEKLSGLLQGVIASPLIHLAALGEGITRGAGVLSGLRRRRKQRHEVEQVEPAYFDGALADEPNASGGATPPADPLPES